VLLNGRGVVQRHPGLFHVRALPDRIRSGTYEDGLTADRGAIADDLPGAVIGPGRWGAVPGYGRVTGSPVPPGGPPSYVPSLCRMASALSTRTVQAGLCRMGSALSTRAVHASRDDHRRTGRIRRTPGPVHDLPARDGRGRRPTWTARAPVSGPPEHAGPWPDGEADRLPVRDRVGRARALRGAGGARRRHGDAVGPPPGRQGGVPAPTWWRYGRCRKRGRADPVPGTDPVAPATISWTPDSLGASVTWVAPERVASAPRPRTGLVVVETPGRPGDDRGGRAGADAGVRGRSAARRRHLRHSGPPNWGCASCRTVRRSSSEAAGTSWVGWWRVRSPTAIRRGGSGSPLCRGRPRPGASHFLRLARWVADPCHGE
jgi:hypothetical protein